MLNLNIVKCGTDVKGTAVGNCLLQLNMIIFFILAKKGWSIDVLNDTLDDELIKKEIQKGNLIVLPSHNNIEDGSEEDVFETLDSGEDMFVRNGLSKFTLQYSKGICFSKALQSLSLKNYDLLMVDTDSEGEGRLWGEVTKDGKFKGFDINLATAGKLSLPTGSTTSKKPFTIQLSQKGTVAFNSRINSLTSEEIDLANLKGIYDVTLTAENVTASDLQISVVDACGSGEPIEGFDDAQLWSIKNTTTKASVVPSAVTFENGIYKFTGVSAGSYTVNLRDVANGYDVIAIDYDQYYKSNKLALTVTA